MAKRFTDSNKWDHAWYRKLTPAMKCVWSYLCDKCDHAGIWTADFESLSFHIGEQLTDAQVMAAFGDKIMKVASDKYFILAFIDFQYGKLNPANRVHQSVLSRLEKEGVPTDLISPLQGAKDKDKDKEQDKDKEPDWNFEAETCLQAVRLYTSDYEAMQWLGKYREGYVKHLGGIQFIRKLKQEDGWTVKRLAGIIKNSWQMLNPKQNQESA